MHRHPTVKMLALSFLLMIGLSLVAEGFGQHIPKGYIYFAMAFSIFVEMLNLRVTPPGPARQGAVSQQTLRTEMCISKEQSVQLITTRSPLPRCCWFSSRHRPRRMDSIVPFVGYNFGGDSGNCPSLTDCTEKRLNFGAGVRIDGNGRRLRAGLQLCQEFLWRDPGHR